MWINASLLLIRPFAIYFIEIEINIQENPSARSICKMAIFCLAWIRENLYKYLLYAPVSMSDLSTNCSLLTGSGRSAVSSIMLYVIRGTIWNTIHHHLSTPSIIPVRLSKIPHCGMIISFVGYGIVRNRKDKSHHTVVWYLISFNDLITVYVCVCISVTRQFKKIIKPMFEIYLKHGDIDWDCYHFTWSCTGLQFGQVSFDGFEKCI